MLLGFHDNYPFESGPIFRGDFFKSANLRNANTRNPQTPPFGKRQVETARVDYFGQLDRCCKLLPALRHLWSRGLHWIALGVKGVGGLRVKGADDYCPNEKGCHILFAMRMGKVRLRKNSCCSYFVISPELIWVNF